MIGLTPACCPPHTRLVPNQPGLAGTGRQGYARVVAADDCPHRGRLLALLLVLAGGGSFCAALVAAADRWPDRRHGLQGAGHDRARRRRRSARSPPADDEDAAFGLGFVHAQDRLFQMELQRRFGAGRLAECSASAAVAIDRQMRMLGLYRRAEAGKCRTVASAVRRALDAYTAGVNAYITHAARCAAARIPAARASSPSPWQPGRHAGLGQADGSPAWPATTAASCCARASRSTVSPDELAVPLSRTTPKDAPTTLAALASVYRQLPLPRSLRALPPDDARPDLRLERLGRRRRPHRERQAAPRQRPASRLRRAGLLVSGPARRRRSARSPAPPSPARRLSWSATTAASPGASPAPTADIEDLFIEKLDPDRPGRYLTPDGSAAFVTRRGNDRGARRRRRSR